MSERYTMVDVRNRAAALAALAKDCGFDTVGWGVARGSKHYSLTYRKAGSSDLLTIDIGESARDSCHRIDMMMLGMEIMREQMEPGRVVRVLKAALLATDKLEAHRTRCLVCSDHMLGIRTNWCDAYKQLLRVREEGARIAASTTKSKSPYPMAISA